MIEYRSADGSDADAIARIGGHDGGVSTMETLGGAVVQSCRYVWSCADSLRNDGISSRSSA